MMYDGQTFRVTNIWTDLSCWWYDRQMSCQIHLNHARDVTPPPPPPPPPEYTGGGSRVGQNPYVYDTPIELGLLM